MILDSSAVAGILLKEPDSEHLADRLASEPDAGIGAPTLAETAIVLSARLRTDARGLLGRFLSEATVVVVPLAEAHTALPSTRGCGSAKGDIRRA